MYNVYTMCPILKLKKHNEGKEIEFELKYLLSLTTRQRFEMMFKKSEEIKRLPEKSGHRPDPFGTKIIKRTEGSGRPEDLEDLFLREIKRDKYRKKKE